MNRDETPLDTRISLALDSSRTAYYAACALRTFGSMPYAALLQHHRSMAAECRGICETSVFACLVEESHATLAKQRRTVGYLAFFSSALAIEAERVRDASLKTRASQASDFIANALGLILEDMAPGLRMWENDVTVLQRSPSAPRTRQATIVDYKRLNQLTLKLDSDPRTIRAALDVMGLLSLGDISAGFGMLAACHPACLKTIQTRNNTLIADWFDGDGHSHDLQEIGPNLVEMQQQNIAANRGHPDRLAAELQADFIRPLALLYSYGTFAPTVRQPARKTVLERKLAQMSH